MTVKSTPFSPVELTGEDATRFIRHINEDKPNPKAQQALDRGRQLLARLDTGDKKRKP